MGVLGRKTAKENRLKRFSSPSLVATPPSMGVLMRLFQFVLHAAFFGALILLPPDAGSYNC